MTAVRHAVKNRKQNRDVLFTVFILTGLPQSNRNISRAIRLHSERLPFSL